MTVDKLYTSLKANFITAKLTDQLQQSRVFTLFTDFEDDIRSGGRNRSLQKQLSSELHSPRISQYTNQLVADNTNFETFTLRLEGISFLDSIFQRYHGPFFSPGGKRLTKMKYLTSLSK